MLCRIFPDSAGTHNDRSSTTVAVHNTVLRGALVNPRATLADLCGGNTQWAWSYLLLPTYQVLMPISSCRDWEVIVK